VALLINVAYEFFAFLCRSWIDVAQQTIQRERTAPDEIRRILGGLSCWMIHLTSTLTPRKDS